MNPEESKQTPEVTSSPESTETPPKSSVQREPPDIKITKRASKSRPVTVYLIVLFLVALLLLIMSFFMQRRSSEALETIHESVSASQDITTLQLENQRLAFELEESSSALTEAQDTITQLEETNAALEKKAQALEWLRQIEEATRTSYPKAKELTEQFEEAGLPQHLPDAPLVEGEDAPAETYRQIYAMLY